MCMYSNRFFFFQIIKFRDNTVKGDKTRDNTLKDRDIEKKQYVKLNRTAKGLIEGVK